MNKIDNILLVDDDYPTNYFNSIIIEDVGCANSVMIMQSAKEALEYLESGFDNHDFLKPNLVFLDINMPGIDGWGFLEGLTKVETTQYDISEIVIVMLSTTLNPDDRIKAIKYPLVKEFINKPLSEENIEFIIGKYFPIS